MRGVPSGGGGLQFETYYRGKDFVGSDTTIVGFKNYPLPGKTKADFPTDANYLFVSLSPRGGVAVMKVPDLDAGTFEASVSAGALWTNEANVHIELSIILSATSDDVVLFFQHPTDIIGMTLPTLPADWELEIRYI